MIDLFELVASLLDFVLEAISLPQTVMYYFLSVITEIGAFSATMGATVGGTVVFTMAVSLTLGVLLPLLRDLL